MVFIRAGLLSSLLMILLVSASVGQQAPAKKNTRPQAAATTQAMPEISFKNVPLGLTLEHFQTLPYSGADQEKVHVDCSIFPPDPAGKKCQCCYVDDRGFTVKPTLAGRQTKSHWFEFVLSSDNQMRLAQIYLSFPSEDFTLISKAYMDRFGKPHNIRTEELTNRMGARFTGCEIGWDDGKHTLVINRYGKDFNTGYTLYTHKDLYSIIERELKEKYKESLQDL